MIYVYSELMIMENKAKEDLESEMQFLNEKTSANNSLCNSDDKIKLINNLPGIRVPTSSIVYKIKGVRNYFTLNVVINTWKLEEFSKNNSSFY